MTRFTLILSLLMLVSLASNSQNIDNFELTNALDGKLVSLSDYSTAKGVALIFIGIDCPFADYYNDRIKLFTSKYNPQGIEVILINSFLDESTNTMKEYATSNKIGIPYLKDQNQELLKLFGVKKAPTAVLLKNTDGVFNKYYLGAIDNNPQMASDVKDHYLANNTDALLANRPIKHKANSNMGCLIRKH